MVFCPSAIISKLMRLDRGLPKIRSKSYSNRVLIDIFDPNLLLKSIEIVATIRNLGPNLNLTSNLYQKWSNLIKNLSNLIKKVRFSIKFDHFLLYSTIFD